MLRLAVMDGPQGIIAVVFVALLLVGGGIAAQYASKETATQHAANETVTAGGVGSLVTLDNSSITGAYYSKNATVTNETGVTLDSPSDYRWYSSNGTLRAESQAAANEQLTVAYDYWTRTKTQIAATGIIGDLIQSGAWIPMLLVLALVVLAVSLLGGLS